MAENVTESVSNFGDKLKGKRLIVIAAAGVGVGFAIRYFRNRNGSNVTPTADASVSDGVADVPDDYLNTPLPTVGNLGEQIDYSNDSGRNPDTLNLPVVGWVVTIDGQQYWTDGETLKPIPKPTAPPVANKPPTKPKPKPPAKPAPPKPVKPPVRPKPPKPVTPTPVAPRPPVVTPRPRPKPVAPKPSATGGGGGRPMTTR